MRAQRVVILAHADRRTHAERLRVMQRRPREFKVHALRGFQNRGRPAPTIAATHRAAPTAGPRRDPASGTCARSRPSAPSTCAHRFLRRTLLDADALALQRLGVGCRFELRRATSRGGTLLILSVKAICARRFGHAHRRQHAPNLRAFSAGIIRRTRSHTAHLHPFADRIAEIDVEADELAVGRERFALAPCRAGSRRRERGVQRGHRGDHAEMHPPRDREAAAASRSQPISQPPRRSGSRCPARTRRARRRAAHRAGGRA